jgi:ELWxxDGT repeat protein
MARNLIAVTLPTAQLVRDVNPGRSSSSPTELTEMGGNVYFEAEHRRYGRELWVTNGTTAGTRLVKDIYQGGDDSTTTKWFSQLTPVNNKLFFVVDTDNGDHLWVTNGTSAGTQDLFGNTGGYRDETLSLAPRDNLLYFTNSWFDDAHWGVETWVTDGTREGTRFISGTLDGEVPAVSSAPINTLTTTVQPLSTESFPLTTVGDKQFFTHSDVSHGWELWASDSLSGNRLVKDIYPGVQGSNSYVLNVIDDQVFFGANDGTHGYELWVSDGSPTGTVRLTDIVPGRIGSAPTELIAHGNQLIFSAADRTHGRELWTLNLRTTPVHGSDRPDVIKGSALRDRLNGAGNNDTLLGLGCNDVLLGGDGTDTLRGGSGADRLSGGKGADLLYGGFGSDILTGGSGRDMFVLALDSGGDRITDFQLRSDRIGLSRGISMHDLTFTADQISYGSTLLATLPGVQTSLLRESDFTSL